MKSTSERNDVTVRMCGSVVVCVRIELDWVDAADAHLCATSASAALRGPTVTIMEKEKATQPYGRRIGRFKCVSRAALFKLRMFRANQFEGEFCGAAMRVRTRRAKHASANASQPAIRSNLMPQPRDN